MTQTTENAVVAFRELRKFCENVCELLTSANEMMEEAGWEHITAHTPVIDVCLKLDDDPNCWLPDSFFCYYENGDSQHMLAFIAVHVDDLSWEPYDPDRVTTPLISAGWLDYGVGVIAKEKWDRDIEFHYSHFRMKDRRDDGTLCSGDAQDVWEDGEYDAGAIKITTLAHSLEEVCSSDALRAKIVRPLLDAIKKGS